MNVNLGLIDTSSLNQGLRMSNATGTFGLALSKKQRELMLKKIADDKAKAEADAKAKSEAEAKSTPSTTPADSTTNIATSTTSTSTSTSNTGEDAGLKTEKFLGMPRTIGITVAVVGGLALIVGGIFLVIKMKKK